MVQHSNGIKHQTNRVNTKGWANKSLKKKSQGTNKGNRKAWSRTYKTEEKGKTSFCTLALHVLYSVNESESRHEIVKEQMTRIQELETSLGEERH